MTDRNAWSAYESAATSVAEGHATPQSMICTDLDGLPLLAPTASILELRDAPRPAGPLRESIDWQVRDAILQGVYAATLEAVIKKEKVEDDAGSMNYVWRVWHASSLAVMVSYVLLRK